MAENYTSEKGGPGTPKFRNYSVKTVDEYIANMPEDARPKLREMRLFVKSVVPEADESISWGVPFYKYHGLLAGFSAFKTYISFGLVVKLPDEIKEELEREGYKTGLKTVQIKFDQEIPVKALTAILENQAKANETKEK